jgi:hypothetical protein
MKGTDELRSTDTLPTRKTARRGCVEIDGEYLSVEDALKKPAAGSRTPPNEIRGKATKITPSQHAEWQSDKTALPLCDALGLDRSGQLQASTDGGRYLYRADGLNQVFIKARRDRFPSIGFESQRGYCNHAEIPKARIGSNGPDKFVSIEAGKHNIRDHSGKIFLGHSG